MHKHDAYMLRMLALYVAIIFGPVLVASSVGLWSLAVWAWHHVDVVVK